MVLLPATDDVVTAKPSLLAILLAYLTAVLLTLAENNSLVATDVVIEFFQVLGLLLGDPARFAWDASNTSALRSLVQIVDYRCVIYFRHNDAFIFATIVIDIYHRHQPSNFCIRSRSECQLYTSRSSCNLIILFISLYASFGHGYYNGNAFVSIRSLSWVYFSAAAYHDHGYQRCLALRFRSRIAIVPSASSFPLRAGIFSIANASPFHFNDHGGIFPGSFIIPCAHNFLSTLSFIFSLFLFH
jgi:hypothetical protein